MHLLFKVNEELGWLVQLLIEENVEVAVWVIEEVLNEAAVKQVAVNVELLVPVDHVLVFKGI